MKYKIRFILTVLILSTLLVALLPSACAQLYGDANEDTRINMQDVTKVERMILELDSETTLADANQDDKISMGDVTYIELIILERKPFPGGELTVAPLWDPSTSSGTQYCGGVSPYGTNIYEPLVFVDNEMNLKPGLAESWERVDDNTWRFYLQEGVEFHDSTPFNADAVEHNLDKWLDDPLFSTILASRLFIVSKDQVEVVDEYTIDITTIEPLGCLPGRLSNPGMVMVSPEMDDYGMPDGTGPFKFGEMIPMQTLDVVRNEQYWRSGPKLEELTIKTIFDASTKVMALETGEVDLIYSVPLSDVSSLEADPDIQVFKKMMPQTAVLRLNAKRAPIDDVNVRKAINYAINRQDIVDYIYEGIGKPARSFIAPVISWSADDELKGYPYNLSKAGELLADAGWADSDGDGYLDRDGETLEIDLIYAGGGSMGFPPHYATMVESIQEQLAEVGIKIELITIEGGMYWPTLMSEDFDILIDFCSPWDGDGSHLISDQCHSEGGFNQGLSMSDENQAAVDTLIEEALTTADPDIIDKNYREVQRIVIDEESAWVPLVYEYEVAAASNSVIDFEIHPLTAWGITMNEVYNIA